MSDKKSPCPSPKVSSDVEDDSKVDLKVPPLKIVIPQTNSNEQEPGVSRSSKSSSQRTHQALPYVVPSSNNDSNEKDSIPGSGADENMTKPDEKKDGAVSTSADDQVREPSYTLTIITFSRILSFQNGFRYFWYKYF